MVALLVGLVDVHTNSASRYGRHGGSEFLIGVRRLPLDIAVLFIHGLE